MIVVLLGALQYFLLDSMAIFNWLLQWTAAVLIIIFFGFLMGIGIHLVNITFGW